MYYAMFVNLRLLHQLRGSRTPCHIINSVIRKPRVKQRQTTKNSPLREWVLLSLPKRRI